MPFTPSHTDEKMLLIPSHAPDQLPLNGAENVSHIPSITPNAVSNTDAIALNAPSITGANRLQNPSHTAFIAEVMSLKDIPNAESRSLIPSVNVANAFLIRSHIFVTAFRKSSFVFHSVTITAASAVIAAIAIPTGDAINFSAFVSSPVAFCAIPALPPANTNFSAKNPIACDTFAVNVISLPTPINNGAMAATNNPMRIMFFFCDSSILFSFSTKF